MKGRLAACEPYGSKVICQYYVIPTEPVPCQCMHLEEGEIRIYFKKDCFLYVNHCVMVLNYVCIDLEVLKHGRK